MSRHVHAWAPLFTEPPDPADKRGYVLHGYDLFRVCACGMIQSWRRLTRGGPSWRNMSPRRREWVRARAAMWNAEMESTP